MMTLSGYSTPVQERKQDAFNKNKPRACAAGFGKHADISSRIASGARVTALGRIASGVRVAASGRISPGARVTSSARRYDGGGLRRYLPFVAALLLFLLVFSSFWGMISARSNEIAPAGSGEVTITVTSGDTLWAIAGQSGLSSDVRRSVFLIQERNGLRNSDLKAGQSLIIPKTS